MNQGNLWLVPIQIPSTAAAASAAAAPLRYICTVVDVSWFALSNVFISKISHCLSDICLVSVHSSFSSSKHWFDESG